MVGDDQLALHNLLVEVLIILSSEGEATTEEGEEKDTAGPNVGRGAAKLFFSDNFGSHVRWCTTENLYLFIVWNAGTESEVDNLYVALSVKHNVLKLDVSVADTFAMAILKCAYDLSIDTSSIIFIHASIWLRL